MLLLTRNTHEIIIIQDNIKLHVLEVNGAQVKLGIDAPKDIPIHRKEIYKRIVGKKD